MMFKWLARLSAVGCVVLASSLAADAQPSTLGPAGAGAFSAAERIYGTARAKLFQIRTLLSTTGQQVSFGSGFLVDGKGRAVTNYHVVSQVALEPGTYRLEYTATDGTRGEAKILAIDLADDLAVVKLETGADGFFQFDERPLAELTKGERLYAMGNPLDLGFSIVEGTYNGLVEHSYVQRVHFSGALNSGMSGGPTVTADGHVVGVNVARQLGGELVSFLVPAQFAAALLAHAPDTVPPPEDLRAQIGTQLKLWLETLHSATAALPLVPSRFGPYTAPQFEAPWFTCWAETNAGRVPKPRVSIDATQCRSDTRVFVSDDLNTGFITLTQSFIRSVDLNAFQFANFLSRQRQSPWPGGGSKKWFTQQRCEEDFTMIAPPENGPPVDAVWCARAYRHFDGLYDVSVMSVTQDSSSQALISRLALQGVTYPAAIELTKKIFAALQWTK